jgi:ketosteroid isomerase-like protein
MKILHLLGALLLAFILINCQSKPNEIEPIDLKAELAGIEQTRQAFMKAVKEKDGETIGKLVTPGVAIISPGGNGWKEMYRVSPNKGPFPYDSIIMSPKETVIVSDSVAYDFGVSRVYYTNPEGEAVELKDSFLVILKKGKDGKWRLHREVASSNVPE